jgi:hypothetical protein
VSSVQDKLNEWKRQLLDLSKRNRLLHFKETKWQTLRVQLPEPGVVFKRVALEERPFTVVGLGKEALLASDGTPAKKDDPAPRLLTVKPGEILFSGSDEKVAGALYTLRLRSRTELEERGVGVLYLAFGFLHWFEADQSDYEIVSPLILVPVELQRDTALAPYRVLHRDDDIVINPTLRKILGDQFKLELPDLPDEETWSLSRWLSTVGKVVSGQKRWRVEDAVYLSALSFLKLNMYRDLELGLGAAESSAIIRALAGDLSHLAAAQGDISEIPASQLDEQVDPASCLQVLDADSSQQQAIELAKAGASFVLQGPPGTGKSQTIANIIAELLGLGRTVLFVSEKAAALEVVQRRLTAVGLADGCLEVHSHKANKRVVVGELARVYALGNGGSSGIATFNYARLRERRLALNEYVRELHVRRDPLGRSVFEVEGLVAQLEGVPEVPFEVGDVVTLTPERLESMRDAITRLSGSADAIAALRENPWRGSTLDGQSLELQRLTRARLSTARDEFSRANDAGRALADAIGLDGTDLTPATIEWMSRISLALADGPQLIGSWLGSDKSAQLIESARAASEQHASAIADGNVVGDVFTDAVLEHDLDGLSDRLHNEYRSAFARLGGAYRHECLVLAPLTKSGKRPSFPDLMRTVPNAIALRDRRRWLASHEAGLREEFGPWYCGHATDWPSLQAALEFAQRISASFAGTPPEAFRLRMAGILSDRDALRAMSHTAEDALEAAREASLHVAGWFAANAPSSFLFAAHDSTPLETMAREADRLVLTCRSTRTSVSMSSRRWGHASDRRGRQAGARSVGARRDDGAAPLGASPHHPGAVRGADEPAGRRGTRCADGDRQQVAWALRRRRTGRTLRRAAIG